ncbi:MAG: hypothetical protein JSV04_14395 [Candidatus Heimdallarchaeota archaeon]|nr:MAG: hypothetical protein JSV04_14395 [Candidatus Heimdallarchaeota archaeon]
MSHPCVCGLLGEFKFPLTSEYFCPNCFSLKFEKKVIKRIPKYIRGHHVAISLSGGKDSVTLLHLLHKYQRKLRINRLTAIILEEEIPEIKMIRRKIVNKLRSHYSDIQIIQKSYTELFGYSLPRLVQQSDEQGLEFTPCAICGVLRRHGILQLSLDTKSDYIALGNTLEDEAGTILLNIMRGTPSRNFRDLIEYKPTDRQSLPLRFKPLSKISEKAILNYTKINHYPILNAQCAYADRSLRSEISTFLAKIEKKDPRVLYNVVSLIKKDMRRKAQVERVQRCRSCTSYSSEPVCSACRIIQKIMS